MFKKTLLALAVAGVSISVNAGTLGTAVNKGDYTDVDAAIAAVATVDECAEVAAELKYPTFKDGNVPAATTTAASAETAEDALIAATSPLPRYFPKGAVVYTGTGLCDVYAPHTLDGADDSKYSEEGVAVNGLSITAKQVAGVGGFKEEDTITFTVTGGTIDASASASATMVSDAGAGAGGEYTLLGVVGNTILFTVDKDAAANEVATLSGVVVTPSAGAETISLESVVQNTANVKYDETPKVDIAELAKQLVAKADVKADGIIDVGVERVKFAKNINDSADTVMSLAGAGEALTDDTLVIEITEQTVNANLTPAEGEIVITGNFSWAMDFDADEDGELNSTELANAYTLASYASKSNIGDFNTNSSTTITTAAVAGDDLFGDAELNEDMTELTIPVTTVNGDIDTFVALTFNVEGMADSSTLNVTDFTADVDFADADEVELNAATDLVVGEWTLNGSVVEVPYIPFGPSTQPIIRHTNTGSQTGDISVRYMVEAGNGLPQSTKWESLGVIVEDAEPGVRNLLNIITEKLETELNTNKFKVALEITTNVPGDDVTVYAAAKITAEGQDRLTIGAFGSKD